MKIAKLVTVEFITRVVVDVDASEGVIAEQAGANIIKRIHNQETAENISEVRDDIECPVDEDDF
jgi:hypothetical protein